MTGKRAKLPSVGFIGAGRVAYALAAELAAGGYPVVAVASRTMQHAERLAQRLPGCEASATVQEVADRAELVFITTSDSAIEAVCAAVTWRAGQTVAHCSGAATAEVLTSARHEGAAVAAFHPITTFLGFDDPVPVLAGVTFGADGDDPALTLLGAVATALGGRLVRVNPDLKALYHAGGVFACNYLVTLLAIGERLMTQAGLEPATASDALRLMMQRTLENAGRFGTTQALSGPVSRGDEITLTRHLDALTVHAPDLAGLYRHLGVATLPIAREKGTLSEAAADLLKLTLTPKIATVGD